MDYEQFKRQLLLSMQKQVGEEVKLELHKIPHNNGIDRDGLVVQVQGKRISPAVNLEATYERWRESDLELDELAGRILAGCRERNGSVLKNTDFLTDFEAAREHIYLRLIHHGRNEAMLRSVPHRHLFDLAMVCYYRIEEGELEGATVTVTDSQARIWGITADQLFAVAGVNSWKKLPVCLMNMDHLIREFCAQENMEPPAELFEQEDPIPMYILTNTERVFGACSIFYPNVQKHLADYLDSSYFILPCSVHELILVPDHGRISGGELQEMVKQINETQVDPVDVLSDTVYYYDAREGRMRIWCD